jgi:Protein of unknown function (DUF3048) N-terminal domain/Protein of unknown function (DUF3048) C-terminal domain
VASTRRRALALVAAVAVAAATATALLVRSGDEQSETTPPTTQPPLPLLPLLGTPGEVPQRAALGVKIDNTEAGRPQTGLAQADVVFEEMVEGGLTRLLAVFHSQDPETVGPVRSARSTDLFILAELGRPLFAWSGANPTFAAAVEAADLVDVGVGATPEAYRREAGRPAPYNLYAASDLLREAVADDDTASIPPPALFSYREPGAALSGRGVEPVTGFRTTGSGALSTDIAWEWDAASASWLRDQDGTPHVDRDGERVRAANVIVRITPYRDSGVRDSVGAVVPEADAIGEGDAWLLSDGQVQRGRWLKPSPDAPTAYVDATGAPLRLTPGQTWVEVLPPGAGDVF